MKIKILHFSDVHFYESGFSLAHLFSKRIFAFLNFFMFRSKKHDHSILDHIINFCKEQNPDYIVTTGDFTTSSTHNEFREAKQFVKKLEQISNVIVLPGNHDCYTKKAEKEKRFYKYFNNKILEKYRVCKKQLSEHLWIISLDCAVATKPLQSFGVVSNDLISKLTHALDGIPKQDKVIIANHFPMASKRLSLKNEGQSLEGLLSKYNNIIAYLHGHIHHSSIKNNNILTLNSGSASCKENAAVFSLEVDLERNALQIKQYDIVQADSNFSLNKGRELNLDI